MNLSAVSIDSARTRAFAADLTGELGKVPAKFVEDAVTGIHRAGSVNLTEVARALEEPIAIHATQKRLSRNLARTDVREVVHGRLLGLAARRIRQDTPLFVHVRDLKKQYARKMEYLMPDSDAVSGPDQGYRICEVVASEPMSDRYTPVIAHLWSPHRPGFESDAAEIVATLHQVIEAANGRGTFYFDESVIEHGLSHDGLSRLDGLVGFVKLDPQAVEGWLHNTLPLTTADVYACDKPYGFTLYKMEPEELETFVVCEIGSMDVRHATRTDEQRSIIVTGFDSPLLRDTPYDPYLTLSTHPVDSSRETLTKVAAASASIYQVVTTNLQHKDAYHLNGFRVLTYDRMQTLLTLCQAVAFYDAAITRQARIDKLVALEPRPGDHKRTFMVPESRRTAHAG
jgi:hypothetical protein